MTKRLQELFNLIDPCSVFADIGCDHGYITQAVLNGRLAKKVYATDVSLQSLNKAKELFGEDNDNVSFFHTDGFDNLPNDIDTALIAGMGGEEICAILKKANVLPKTLILQPMKNSEKLRRLVIDLGYFIKNDYMFFDGDKFYEVIKCVNNGIIDHYSENDYVFGRDNLIAKSKDFRLYLTRRMETLSGVLDNLSEEKKEEMISEIKKLQDLLC